MTCKSIIRHTHTRICICMYVCVGKFSWAAVLHLNLSD